MLFFNFIFISLLGKLDKEEPLNNKKKIWPYLDLDKDEFF